MKHDFLKHFKAINKIIKNFLLVIIIFILGTTPLIFSWVSVDRSLPLLEHKQDKKQNYANIYREKYGKKNKRHESI